MIFTKKLKDRIVLPEGLKFENNKLTGSLAHVGLYRIDLVATSGSNKAGIKVLINIVPDEADLSEEIMDKYPEPKKGCGGSITAISGAMALIAGLGIAVLSFTKKKKRA